MPVVRNEAAPTNAANTPLETVAIIAANHQETISRLIKIQETYTPDPPTVHRDVNASPNKEVFHGIDIPIADQGYEGKPLGLASFKSFLANPETQKIEAEKGAAMQDVHRAKSQLSASASPSYKSMVKAQAQDN